MWTTSITSSLQSEELIPSLLKQLESVIPYDRATLWLYDSQNLRIASSRGFLQDRAELSSAELAEEKKLIQEVLRTRNLVSIPDRRDNEGFNLISESEFFSWLGMPLLSKGEVIGIMALDKKEAGFYTKTHIQIGATFAGQAAVALENARLYQSILSTAERLEIFETRMSAKVKVQILESEKIYQGKFLRKRQAKTGF